MTQEDLQELMNLADEFDKLAKQAEKEADQPPTDSNRIKRLLFSNEHHQWLLAENMLLKKLKKITDAHNAKEKENYCASVDCCFCPEQGTCGKE